MNQTSVTSFTRKTVKYSKRVKFHSKKNKNHSKRVTFHSKKSENQSVFTPTQKCVFPNSILSRVKMLLFHTKKSDFHSWKSERVKFYSWKSWLGTRFVKWEWRVSDFHSFGVIITLFWVNFHFFEVIFTLFRVNGVLLVLFALLHLARTVCHLKARVRVHSSSYSLLRECDDARWYIC